MIMVFLIVLIYFIIGFIGGLIIYDYHCKDYKKNYKSLTWEYYSSKESIGFIMGFILILWPIVLLIVFCHFIFNYPLSRIRKRNGIE